MKIELYIKKELFPKLFDVEDNLDEVILFLLNIGYQNFYSSVNEKSLIDNMNNTCRQFKDDIIKGFESKNDNLKDKILLLENNLNKLNTNEKLDEMSRIIEKLFGISNNSSKKGAISEQLIYSILEEKYSNYSYDVKRHIAHNADGELTSPTGMKCLVEIKNYTNTVNKDEVDKFKYDLKFTKNNYGIFISLQTGIAFKNMIDYETYQDNDETYHIIYIGKIMEDINKLNCGILLLENIFKINKKDNIDLKIGQIKEVIYSNFNELESLISKTNDLRSEYSKLENTMKLSFDTFYNKLRAYEMELKEKMQKIWMNLFSDLDQIDKKFVDEKTNILSNISEKDKCFNILSRLFDILKSNDINVTGNDNKYCMIKNKIAYGEIKKMKDKLQINFTDSNTITTIKTCDNLDNCFNIVNLLIKNN